MTRPRLIVLPPSHYCERARWGLDHMGVAHDEERLAVPLHVLRARRLAPRSSLPILVADGRVTQGSGAILDRIGIGGGAPEVEERLERRVGRLVRDYLYAGALDDPRSGVLDMLVDGVPPGEARLARALWPLTRRLMIAGFDARPARLPALEATLSAELDWVDALVDGRPHLVGDGLGRADITVASLLAPLLRPAPMPVHAKVREPARVEATLARWAERPSFAFVRRLYTMRHAGAAAG